MTVFQKQGCLIYMYTGLGLVEFSGKLVIPVLHKPILSQWSVFFILLNQFMQNLYTCMNLSELPKEIILHDATLYICTICNCQLGAHVHAKG